MNNPWEVPRHDNPIRHSTPNPTQADTPMNLGGGDSQMQVGAPGNYGGGSAKYKFIWVSVGLSIILGPLGLFYVGPLHGIGALAVGSTVVPFIAVHLAKLFGGGYDLAGNIGVGVLWCVTVPWAIIATRRNNAKLGYGPGKTKS